jgi:hypothetical protein
MCITVSITAAGILAAATIGHKGPPGRPPSWFRSILFQRIRLTLIPVKQPCGPDHSITVFRRLSLQARQFRVASTLSELRSFWLRKLHSRNAGTIASFVDPLRLSAGRALTNLPRALALSVVHWLSNEIPTPSVYHRTRTTRSRAPIKRTRAQPRVPEIDLTDALPQQVSPTGELFVHSRRL